MLGKEMLIQSASEEEVAIDNLTAYSVNVSVAGNVLLTLPRGEVRKVFVPLGVWVNLHFNGWGGGDLEPTIINCSKNIRNGSDNFRVEYPMENSYVDLSEIWG